MNIPIGCDHAGYKLKDNIKAEFEKQGFTFDDKGTYGPDSVDYPDYAHAVAKSVEDGAAWGILICGSAQGVAMTANKHQKIRAAVVWEEEIAKLARQHNNANIICLPARFISDQEAIRCVAAFASTAFEGGRHENRVNKIAC